MMQKSVFCCLLTIIGSLLFFGFKQPGSFQKAGQVSFSDTTIFNANTAEGWNLLSLYQNQVSTDSVELELILKKDSAVNWRAEQLVGIIADSSFHSQNTQTFTYDLLTGNQWSITITPEGQCFVRQLEGAPLPISLFPGSPFVLPIKLKYASH